MTQINPKIYPRGSEWRKWDLHIHSLHTHLFNKYRGNSDDDFIKKIKESNLEVIGLTNYFNFFDDDFKLKEKIEKEGIVVFLNLELRLTYQNKEDDCCDLHIIFDNELEKEKIQQFLSNLTVCIDKNEKKANLLSGDQDFEKTVIEFDKLRETLDEKSLDIKERYLIGFLSRGKGNARSSTVYAKIAESSKFLIHSSKHKQNLEKDYKYWLQHNKPLVQSSDAHQIVGIGSKYTWIKATPTFEGLRQIIFEPEARIFIGEGKPKKPINTIDSITLKVPSDAKVGEDTFCFAGINKMYNLSPYFNCFIGGRGSGKSTVLNFLGLHSNNSESSKLFWFGDGKDKKGLSPFGFDPNDNTIFLFSGTEIFEFLAQSEIETFARDKIKFTQAIYDRANGPSKVLQKFEDDISKYQNHLDKIIEAVFDLQELLLQKRAKEKEKRSLENTKNIIESKDYKKLTDSISELTQKIQVHKKWSNEADLLKIQLKDTIELYSKALEGNNDQIKYKDSYLLAISKVKEAIEILDVKNFEDAKKEEKSHQDNLLILEEELKKLLNKGNFSEDNIEQIKSAPQKIVALEREIEQIDFLINSKNKIIASLDSTSTSLIADKGNYENKIKEIVEPLQKLLEKQYENNKGKDIKKISLEYSFDEDRAWGDLVREFYEKFRGSFKDSEKGKDVCDYITNNKDVFATNVFLDVQKSVQQSQKSDRQYIKFLDEVFKDKNNFQVFQAIRDKHLSDVKTNKIIQVKYNDKNVEQASFGQRCTAVVVILLLFGNYPLIIDEPEAHLDSSLIANYLVPLLKEKKSDRQIIFATHNANFVINGDAEKILILKNESGQTKVIETTIEDITNREELLKLEGGKEAFEKRGEKLNLIRHVSDKGLELLELESGKKK